MGTVEKRGKNSWRIATQVKIGGEWQWVRFTLRMDPALSEAVQRRDAERELDNLERRLSRELADMCTLREWSETWLTKYVSPDASPVTVANYRFLLRSRILPQLGDLLLKELTPAILTDWLTGLRASPRKTTRKTDDQLARPRRKGEKLIPDAKLQAPLSAKTAQNYFGCVKSMLAVAVRIGLLEYNPMDRVQRPKKKKRRLSTLSESETLFLIRSLADAPQGLRRSVLLALCCGIRLGEAAALTWFDVDWDHDMLRIDKALKYTPARGSFIDAPKTEAGDRVIQLPAALRQILRDALWEDVAAEMDAADKWQGKDRWIIHDRYGRRVNKDTPSRWFRAFADQHGFQGVTFHDLRHAHASLLVAKGVDIAAVSARLGHSDPSITLSVYTHALPNRDQAAAEAMDAVLKKIYPPPPGADPQQDPPAAAQPAGSCC